MNKVEGYLKYMGDSINENKYCIGIAMILLNIGARFIIDELGDDLRKFVSNPYIRRFFIFCSFFIATKDIFKSITLTIFFVIIITEFCGNESGEEEEGGGKGASYNKVELEKTIAQLKNIQLTL